MTITPRLSSRHAPGRDVAHDDAADWRAAAACRTEDPELFFPVGENFDALAQAEQAKRVCDRCPVIGACFRWGIETGEQYGVFGGTSERDRRDRRGPRRRFYETQRAAVDLALTRGCDILVAHRAGQTRETIASWAGSSPAAVRQALRILVPGLEGSPVANAVALERIMHNYKVLRDLMGAGRTDGEIAGMLRFSVGTVAAARQILAHQDAAAARPVRAAS